ncbi:hypothetical protein [Spirosoma montaniterrae]|uniref:Uncharacterized protein n=1 Tax=Spirosoma montaniterrae TaxID=1178516 RepID=A0A1P9WYV0_9BACT|nr:hypothetical protein [Spirosoma montaniterrae]AQG80557.1 hypothetical protein AWR27_15230 [Spirosoma montaniterrae]
MKKSTLRCLLSSETLYNYCLGLLPANKTRQVSRLERQYPAVRAQIDQTLGALRRYSTPTDFVPQPADTQRLLRTLRALAQLPVELEQLPLLDAWADVGRWRQAVATLQPPPSFKETYVYPLRDDATVTQLLVWVDKEVSVEEHLYEQESILILEGYCNGYVGSAIFQLAPGDYLDIPTRISHSLQVVEGPVQLIVQRIKESAF